MASLTAEFSMLGVAGRRLRVGQSTLKLRFWREGEQSRWEVVEAQTKGRAKEIEVLDEPVPPASTMFAPLPAESEE